MNKKTLGNKTKKAVWFFSFVVLAAVLLGGGIILGVNWNHWFGRQPKEPATVDSSAKDYTGDQDTYAGKKNTDTIDIPGFDIMNLKAGEKKQNVNLYNPPKNTCYFKMSIILDGKTLWESSLVEPGKAIYELTLKETLPAGEYPDAVLKYECFKMDENQTPLNGSEVKFTMNVME